MTRKKPPANGTYSGSVSQTTSSSGSSGTDGTLSLTVSQGTVTGSATLPLVDPTTGVATPSERQRRLRSGPGGRRRRRGNSYFAEDCSAFLTRLGMFCLPSTRRAIRSSAASCPRMCPGSPSAGSSPGPSTPRRHRRGWTEARPSGRRSPARSSSARRRSHRDDVENRPPGFDLVVAAVTIGAETNRRQHRGSRSPFRSCPGHRWPPPVPRRRAPKLQEYAAASSHWPTLAGP